MGSLSLMSCKPCANIQLKTSQTTVAITEVNFKSLKNVKYTRELNITEVKKPSKSWNMVNVQLNVKST